MNAFDTGGELYDNINGSAILRSEPRTLGYEFIIKLKSCIVPIVPL